MPPQKQGNLKMDELRCSHCGKQIGWISNGGFLPWVECDECYEKQTHNNKNE
jgi:phage FluMu protein Com